MVRGLEYLLNICVVSSFRNQKYVEDEILLNINLTKNLLVEAIRFSRKHEDIE